jgi:capsular polysaccharide export protein
MLRQTRNELQQTQSTLKNMLLYANAQKKAGDEFLPESLYQTPGRRVATFERDEHLAPGGFKDTYHILFNTNTLQEIKNNVHVDESDYSVFHFWRDDFRNSQQVWALYKSILGTPAYFVEASFITSIHAFTTKSWPIQFRRLYSFLADDLSFYFDALQPGRIAQYLNSAEARLDAEQQRRCRELIRYIVDNRLTKYNFLSLAEPEVLNKPGRKVLVVDQTAGDASITRGRASADSFKRMLKAAVQENQGAAIYVKTHPDTVTRAKRCYYADVAEAEVIKLTEAVNPYSILRHMDKVYVCTSQLGLEALMAGKEVVTFGQPIYAGWGLTDDRLPGAARGNQLTLEDLFFALYIKFAVHIHPYTYTICPIEDYLPAMVKLREEYFKYLEDTGKKA